jgi:hypothetical protein
VANETVEVMLEFKDKTVSGIPISDYVSGTIFLTDQAFWGICDLM